jgi:hypothetical protein
MAIKEIKKNDGKINFKVDFDRRIVFETNSGLWKKEEILAYQKVHETEVEPILNKNGIKPWAKISDLRDYKMSLIVDEVNYHSKWIIEKGCTHVAVIVPNSVLVKNQMKRSVDGSLTTDYFSTVEDAEKWIKSVGF